MKPRKLSITNIGPFVGTVSIDFSTLDEVFLVCGDTGAGKTTILDCMAYALYGSAPGTRGGRERDMKSHWAERYEEAAVEFEFESGGERYHVARKPARERAKARGTGTTDAPAEAVFRKHGEGAWRVLAAKTGEVDAEIQRVLGFTKEEFWKIVLLPQGEFQRFLEMNSKERGEILEKLFPVEIHGAVTELAKAKLLRAEEAVKRLDGDIAALGPDAAPDAADASLERNGRAVAAAKTELDAARAAESSAKQSFDRAADSARAFDAAGEAARILSVLESQGPLVETREAALAAASRARELSPLLDALHEKALALESAGKRASDAERRFVELEAGKSAIEAAERDLAGLAEKIRASHARIGGLRSAVQAWSRFLDSMTARDDAAAEAGRASAASAAVDERLGNTRAEADRNRPGTEEESRTRERLDVARTALNDAARIVELSVRRAHLGAAREARERELVDANVRIDAARDRAENASRDVARIEKERDGASAAFLAASLVEGSPCPVCGSVHHPKPAVASGDSEELRSALTAAKSGRDAASIELERLSADRGGASTALRMLDEELAKSPADLPGLDIAEAARAAAETELAAATTAHAGLEARKRRAAGLDTILSDLVAESGKLSAEAAGRAATLAAADSSVNAAREAAGPSDPHPLLAEEETAAAVATEEHGALERRVAGYGRDVAAAGAERSEVRRGMEEAERSFDATRSLVDRELCQRGFRDADEARAAAWPDGRMAAERSGLSEYRERLAAARDGDARCSRAVEGRERPDLAATETALGQAAAAVTELDKRLSDVTGTAAAFADQAARCRRLLEGRSKLAADSALLKKLFMVLNGDIQGKRLSFQAFALGRWFESVVACAAVRLHEMSDGRYRLALDREASRGNAKIGLEILVSDSFTGRDRAAASLSGGEKFMASIALALGLADVVSGRAAGSPVESVFIDEGFGSLDEDALDRAIEVLDRVRAGRMVGIVSHVAELRSRIPSRIEVRKGRTGSTIEIVG
ncbi:MAG: AAA family ATPase [Spirochaetes bacterium]|nr:AAA family ATPase [Spirochaetota bacterium]